LHILSFDTSTERLQVALLHDGQVVCERSLEPESSVLGEATSSLAAGEPANAAAVAHVTAAVPALPRGRLTRKKFAPRQQMATSLLPVIDAALIEARWQRSDLECIVVGTGPGGFTAIRTGVVTARTLAQALNLPLVPVSLLQMYASVCQLPCAIVLAAGKDHFFVAAYEAANSPASAAKFDPNVSSAACSALPPSAWPAPSLIAPFANASSYNAETLEPNSTEAYLSAVDASHPFSHFAETVGSAYVSAAEIGNLLGPCTTWAVPTGLRETFLAPGRNVIELPKVKNIATRQGQIAWNRLSLTLSWQPDTKHESEPGAPEVRKRLLEQYPYSSVQPLYLRDPSITVKAANST
jgi:tRNA threonylcarbamoyl adenosine modification protein YeaZ